MAVATRLGYTALHRHGGFSEASVRYFVLFGVWSCVSVCSRFIETNTPSPDGSTDSAAVDSGNDTAPPAEGAVKHVVVLVTDGARIDETFGSGYSTAAAVNTDTLYSYFKSKALPAGTLILPGYNTDITITAPGHGDLLSGTHNQFGHFATPDGPGAYRPENPTLFELVRQKWPETPAYVIGNTDHVHPLQASVYPGVGENDGAVYAMVTMPDDSGGEKPANEDADVVARVQELLTSDSPSMIVANLHQMDRTGHYNDAPRAYAQDVERSSQPIADFISWVQSDESGFAENTLVVVVADHGRHRWGDVFEERAEGAFLFDYQEHGDQCAGCREIPMFLAGPGIRRGATVTTPHTLADVGTTIAALLGVNLDYATGIVIREALEADVDVADRSGVAEVAVESGLSAEVRYTGNAQVRSEVVVNGEVLSGTGFSTGGLAVYGAEGGPVVCWRELDLAIGTDQVDWPWEPNCWQQAGSTWSNLEFPIPIVWPSWTPGIAELADGSLLFAFADNEQSNAYSPTRAGIAMLRYIPGLGWSGSVDERNGAMFPGNPDLVVAGDVPYVAYADSDLSTTGNEATGRYTRHIVVASAVGFPDISWTELFRTTADGCPEGINCPERRATADSDGTTWLRSDFPALGEVDGHLDVAYVSFNDGEVALHVSRSNAEVSSFATPERADLRGAVLGNVQPVWSAGALYFAELTTTGSVGVCRWTESAGASCIDTESPAVRGLSADGANVSAVVLGNDRVWSEIPIAW